MVESPYTENFSGPEFAQPPADVLSPTRQVLIFALLRGSFTLAELKEGLRPHISVDMACELDAALPIIMEQAIEEMTVYGVPAQWVRQEDNYLLMTAQTEEDVFDARPPHVEVPLENKFAVVDIALKRLVWHTAKSGVPLPELLGWMQNSGLREGGCIELIKDLERLGIITISKREKNFLVFLEISSLDGQEYALHDLRRITYSRLQLIH